MSSFGVLPVVFAIATWQVTETGADGWFSTTGYVYCSSLQCNNYSAQVSNSDYFMSYFTWQYQYVELCTLGHSEAQIANKALEEFYRTNCSSFSSSMRTYYDLRRIAAACSDISSINMANIYYKCLPVTVNPTAVSVGRSTNRSATTADYTEGLTHNFASTETGSGDEVLSTSTQPRGVIEGDVEATIIIAVVIGSAAIISAAIVVLVYIRKRKLCLRQAERTANRTDTNEASLESRSSVMLYSGATYDECVLEFKTCSNVPATGASRSEQSEIFFGENAYAHLGSPQCDRIYESLKA